MAEDIPVIIVGAGPIGMVLAYQLDRLNVPCLIAEQNLETTKWPKMDLTNCRSMELLRYLGLADDYRAQPGSVSENERFDTQFVTQINSGGKLLSTWSLPPVSEQRKYAHEHNDGSQPSEPEQRCSQIIFEAWMKNILLEKPNITTKFGWKYISHEEDSNGVTATFTDLDGNTRTLRARYFVGCDGGGSRVRRTAGIKLIGGPMPMRFHLVHFRSEELSNSLPFGRFWHIFAANGGFIIDQDNKDTFTAHMPVHLISPKETDPREIVYSVLGSVGSKHRIQIDEILVDSEWTPNYSISTQYHTDNLRVFLAGDAAHRSPPHGGYGMNSGLVDAVDLGWRLSAMTKGYGGPKLLKTYNTERRPNMIRAMIRSHRHLIEHVKLAQLYDSKLDLLDALTPEGEALRKQVDDFLQDSAPETRDRGIEFDLRYYSSPIVVQDGSVEPGWEVGRYTPSTRPGSRAPHVFLKDGKTSVYDFLGSDFTLVWFVDSESGGAGSQDDSDGSDAATTTSSSTGEEASELFQSTASSRGIPLKCVRIENEPHVHQIWERELVLVRHDTHVAWRGDCAEVLSRLGTEGVHGIWDVVTGHKSSASADESPKADVEIERAFEKIVGEFLGAELRGKEELGIEY